MAVERGMCFSVYEGADWVLIVSGSNFTQERTKISGEWEPLSLGLHRQWKKEEIMKVC